MKKRRLGGLGYICLALVAVISALFPAVASADITTVCRFSGPVTIDGLNAPPDTEVEVSLNGVTNTWNAQFFSHYGVTWYLVDVPLDDPGTPAKDGGVNGDTVNFTISIGGTIIAGSADTFQMTSLKYHALNVFTSPFAISTYSLPDGKLGTLYSKPLSIVGGVPPYIWNITGLPAGLSVNTTGVVTGIPQASGYFNVTINVAAPLITPMTAMAVLPLRIWIPGDANGDDVVNVVDIVYVQMVILGMRPETLGTDANLDGVVNVTDIARIEMIILGISP